MAKPKIPLPPSTLTIEPSDIVTHEGFLFRVYPTAGNYPQSWNELREYGPIPGMRFDPHPPPEGNHPGVGVMYTALHPSTALAEVYQDEHVIDRAMKGNALVFWEVTRTLQLLDLTQRWPVRNNGAAAMQMGDKENTSAWAHAIHTQFGGQIDGLFHRSSVDNQKMITLFERSKDSFPDRPDFNELLSGHACDAAVQQARDDLGYTSV